MSRLAVAGVGLIAACAGIARLPNLAESPTPFLGLFGLAFLCYGAAVWRTPASDAVGPVSLVLGVAVIARLVLLPAPPTLSTDAYRYVWDARVARAGLDPYAYAPMDSRLEPLRDAELFPRLNHATWRTIYPPAAEALFRIVYRVRPDSVRAMKLAIALAELAGLLALLGLLRATGRPLSSALIYAWNPLVLVEVWGMGHLDGVVVPIVVAAMWALVRHRDGLAGALLGAGALVKLYPAALLALLPVAAWPRALAAFALVLAVGYAPGLATGSAVFGSLPRYLHEEYFNPGLVRSAVDLPALTLVAAAAWLLAVGTARRAAPLPERAVLLIGGLLLLSPNLFPWYAIWLVPFLAWAPSVPWLAFTGTLALAYAFFLERPWGVPGWARGLEVAPLVLGGLWWLAARVAAPRWRVRSI